ncbi:DUF4174 domain-containing protein [Paraferrimonas haliotis]|uniref:DUF4174 domain-containing protein n=1 Tax=Paraferrimonas haliotis TaxID=2013866 RepID=A0AA37TP39_9GAMM|nr:DUF4174 domain-containing protein [Paraferrimonas haliotis]GLS85027.1 hypothetical protein GCM10007894_30040 [Paraferrimonas haliotis]
MRCTTKHAIQLLSGCLLVTSLSALSYPEYQQDSAHRSLIYFAPSYDESVAEFEHQAEIHKCVLTARNTRVLIVTPETNERLYNSYHNFDWNQLKASYQIQEDDYTLILVGSNGNETQRWQQPDWEELFSLLDSTSTEVAKDVQRLKRCSA